MDGKSLNITEKKLYKLKEIIPEAFTENKIDWEKLKASLGGKVDKEIIKKVIKVKPQKVITLDCLFNNNNQLKTNTALQMKDADIEFKVV